MVKPTVISVFAGCGGSSLGYQMAGFNELLAIEWDKNAVETFKLNFKCPVWLKDITKASSSEILKFCNIKKGELSVLDGSPPCQGFSTAGKRQVNDNRNRLFEEYVRLIKELQPKVFVMENVSGMIKGKMKGVFVEIMETLKTLNYNVKCKLMNAKYYEVPQSRQRVIFIGSRKDNNRDITFPKSSNKLISVSSADKGDRVSALYSEKRYGDVLLKRHKPCVTITKLGRLFYDRSSQYGIDSLKSFSSFPFDWKFNGSYTQAKDRIGNAVPPKFMYHIAKNIKENILN